MSAERSGSFSQAPSLDVVMIGAKNNGSLALGVSTHTPQWVSDRDALNCMVCDKKFNSMTRRIHHCRACGFVVCNSCSLSRLQLPHTAGRVRVCDRCIKDMEHKPVATSVENSISKHSINSVNSQSVILPPGASPGGGVGGGGMISPVSSAIAGAPQQNPTTNPKQWQEKMEKEREMALIINGHSNGYAALPDLYNYGTKAITRQRAIVGSANANNNNNTSLGVPPANLFTTSFEAGVGQDVPDWAYLLHPFSRTAHIARIGRLKIKINKIAELSLNNITPTLNSNVPNQTYQTTLDNGQAYVKDATLSAIVILNATTYQTPPSNIIVTGVDTNKDQDKVMRAAKGFSVVNQRCLLDVCDVSEIVQIDLIINKTMVSKVTNSDGTITRKTNTVTIPIGHINIPLTSLKLNQAESLTLHLSPHSTTAAAIQAGNPSQKRILQQHLSKATTPSTIQLDVELCCSENGYLLSQYKNVSVAQPTNEVTMHNIIQYGLLILHQLQPILNWVLFIIQLLTWKIPVLTTLLLFAVVIVCIYPLSLPLLFFFGFILKTLLVPFFTKNFAGQQKQPQQATPTTEKTDSSTAVGELSGTTVTDIKRVEFTDQKALLALQLDNNNISSSTLPPTNTSVITPSVIHNIASLSPDSQLSITTSTQLMHAASSDSNSSNAARDNLILTGSTVQHDYSFAELFLELLNDLLPLVATTNGQNHYIIKGIGHNGNNNGGIDTELASGKSLINLNNLLSFFQSLFNIYATIITPFVDLITWKNLGFNVALIILTLMGFFGVFFVPSNMIYILIGVVPFIYTSPPCRLLRVYLARK